MDGDTWTGGMACSMGAGSTYRPSGFNEAAVAPVSLASAAFSFCMAKKWCVFLPLESAASVCLTASRSRLSDCFASVSAASRRSCGVMKNDPAALRRSSLAAFRFKLFLRSTPAPADSVPCSTHDAQNHSPSGTDVKSTHFAWYIPSHPSHNNPSSSSTPQTSQAPESIPSAASSAACSSTLRLSSSSAFALAAASASAFALVSASAFTLASASAFAIASASAFAAASALALASATARASASASASALARASAAAFSLLRCAASISGCTFLASDGGTVGAAGGAGSGAGWGDSAWAIASPFASSFAASAFARRSSSSASDAASAAAMAAASSASSAASLPALVGILGGSCASSSDPEEWPLPPKNEAMPGPDPEALARAGFFAGGLCAETDLGSDAAGVDRLPRTSARDLAGSPPGPAGVVAVVVVVVVAAEASVVTNASGDRDAGRSSPTGVGRSSSRPPRSSSSMSTVCDRGSDDGRSGVPADLPPLPGASIITAVFEMEVPNVPAPTFSVAGESPPPVPPLSFAPVAPGADPAWSTASDASIRVAPVSLRGGTRVPRPFYCEPRSAASSKYAVVTERWRRATSLPPRTSN